MFQEKRNKIALILGAGFSHASGFPLASNVFEFEKLPWRRSDVKNRDLDVRKAWKIWSQKNPDKGGEEWLRYLYEMNEHDKTCKYEGITYNDAKNYLLANLVNINSQSDKAPLIHGITKSVEFVIHRKFWAFILSRFELSSVITMNYDILAEQGMREKYHGRNREVPLCYYGGLDHPQIVKRVRDPIRKKSINMELTGNIPICKMHGSLNWAFEKKGFIVHEDVRAAFRTTKRMGEAAIIPPIPDKKMKRWMVNVWDYAEKCLTETRTWVVCGYSMPHYDEALNDFFSRVAKRIKELEIKICDPKSHKLKEKWEMITNGDAKVTALPGLPEVLHAKYWE